MLITDQERRAIDEFLAALWDDFLVVAGNYLDAEEIKAFEKKLTEPTS